MLLLLAACQSQLPPGVRRLPAPQGYYSLVRWSPDGQSLGVLFHPRGNPSDQSVLILAASGGLQQQIVAYADLPFSQVDVHQLAWQSATDLTIGADVSLMVELRRQVPPDRSTLFRYDLLHPAAPAVPLTSNQAWLRDLDWHPDGTVLGMVQSTGPPSRHPQRPIALRTFDASRGDTQSWRDSPPNMEWPRWSPDGRQLLYLTRELAGPHEQVAAHIELVFRDWATGTETRFHRPDCVIAAPDWSPDGQWVLYREICRLPERYTDHLVIAPVSDLTHTQEVCGGMILNRPDWGPDGTIVAMTVAMGENELVVCEVPASGAGTDPVAPAQP